MKGVGEEGGWRCHGCGAAVAESRRREALPGLWSPVREGRLLLFWPRDLALGGIAGVSAAPGGGVDPGAVSGVYVWGRTCVMTVPLCWASCGGHLVGVCDAARLVVRLVVSLVSTSVTFLRPFPGHEKMAIEKKQSFRQNC